METDIFTPLIQTESPTTNPWAQHGSERASQAEIESETFLYIYENNAVSYWFPIPNSLSQRIKLEPGTITLWIQKEWQIVHLLNRLETKVAKTGYNVEADTSLTILTYSKSGEIIPWTRPESPLLRKWPELEPENAIIIL